MGAVVVMRNQSRNSNWRRSTPSPKDAVAAAHSRTVNSDNIDMIFDTVLVPIDVVPASNQVLTCACFQIPRFESGLIVVSRIVALFYAVSNRIDSVLFVLIR